MKNRRRRNTRKRDSGDGRVGESGKTGKRGHLPRSLLQTPRAIVRMKSTESSVKRGGKSPRKGALRSACQTLIAKGGRLRVGRGGKNLKGVAGEVRGEKSHPKSVKGLDR